MDSTNTHLLPGTVLGNKWRLGNRLGAGACADVFDVESTASPSAASSSSPVPYVAKCIALPTGNTKSTAYKERNRVCDTLFYEYTLYTNGVLYGFDYAPKIPPGAYGNDKGHRYLIMEKLDYDLKSMVSRRASSLTVGRIAEIGLDVLSGLEFIHKKGFLFVDVKPENFMMKVVPSGEEKLRFIDFGLMEKYTQYTSGGAQRERGSRAAVAGTHLYASLAVLRGEVPSRRDDVEAMGYMLLSLAMPLPWENVHSAAELLQKKESCDINALASRAGCEFLAKIIHICRDTAYGDAPDYTTIRKHLQQGTKITTLIRGSGGTDKSNRRSSAGRKLSKGKQEELCEESPLVVDRAAALSNASGSAKSGASAASNRKGRGKVTEPIEDEKPEPRPTRPRSTGKSEIEATTSASNTAVVARGRKSATRSVDSTVDLTFEPDEDAVDEELVTVGKKRRAANITSSVAVDLSSSSLSTSVGRSSFIIDAPAAACAIEPNTSTPPAKRSGRVKAKLQANDSRSANFNASEPPALEIVLKAQGGLFGDQSFPVRGSFNPKKRVTKNAKRSRLDAHDCTVIGRFEDENASPRISSNRTVKLETDDYVSERHAAVQCIIESSGATGIRIQDLNSTNGVKLNGKKLPANEWVNADLGDTIKIGQTKFMVAIRKVT